MNARYCDSFPHVRWKDGEIVHVNVTPDVHREYDKKLKVALQAIQNRCEPCSDHPSSIGLPGLRIDIQCSATDDVHVPFVQD